MGNKSHNKKLKADNSHLADFLFCMWTMKVVQNSFVLVCIKNTKGIEIVAVISLKVFAAKV